MRCSIVKWSGGFDVGCEFVGTCVHLRAEDLEDYDDTEREIGYDRFRYYVGDEIIRELERELGYHGSCLTLKKDYHVRYGRGKWKGENAVCMRHSAIHYIWKI